MAHIKIPYVYTSYPFSEDATQYSKRLAKGSQSWGWPSAFVAFLILMLLVDPLTELVSNDFLTAVLYLIPFAAAIAAWIYAEKLRKRYFRKKIRAALEEDLALIEKAYPAQAAVYRTQLKDILETK